MLSRVYTCQGRDILKVFTEAGSGYQKVNGFVPLKLFDFRKDN